MLIATVAMAVITAFGVYFVWRTLVAIQDMARETRVIGRAQVRAYLWAKSAKWTGNFPNAVPELEVTITNSGTSPAARIEVEGTLAFWSKLDSELLKVVLRETVEFNVTHLGSLSIAPGGQGVARLKAVSGISGGKKVNEDLLDGVKRIRGRATLPRWSASIQVKWHDVFHQPHAFHFNVQQADFGVTSGVSKETLAMPLEIGFQSANAKRYEAQ